MIRSWFIHTFRTEWGGWRSPSFWTWYYIGCAIVALVGIVLLVVSLLLH